MTTDTDDIEIHDAHVSDYDGAAKLVREGLMEAVNEQYGVWSVKYLLEHGADPSLLDEYGDSPLDIARYHNDQEVIDELISHGAEGEGRGPLPSS